MCDLACNEGFGDHANHFAASRKHCISNLAHHPDVCAAINQSEATFNECDACLASGVKILWGQTRIRSAEDADSPHGSLFLRRSGVCLGVCPFRRSGANGVSRSWLPITCSRRKLVEPLVVRVPATMPMMSCFSTNL